jgi:phosphate acetyltransferase
MNFIETMRERVRGKGLRIVYPEGLEERALKAAAILRDGDLAKPVLIGARVAIEERARAAGVSLDGIEVRHPAGDPSTAELTKLYHELRKHKGVTEETARAKALQPHYFAALMVRAGQADGFVSGLNSETKPFLPAFEVVQMAPGIKRASSVFIMVWPDRTLFYADCSVNIAPDAATLAETARATAASARSFGFDPKVAFLSFSTRDSAKDASIDKVKEALKLARAATPDLVCDGEMQFDAAFVPAVAKKKCPDSPLGGEANVFIFPDLNAGNIAYKITERLAGAAALGPIMQGLNQPVNDVSRGCSAQDLADVAVITAVQTGKA